MVIGLTERGMLQVSKTQCQWQGSFHSYGQIMASPACQRVHGIQALEGEGQCTNGQTFLGGERVWFLVRHTVDYLKIKTFIWAI